MRFRLLAMIFVCFFILLWNQQAFADFQESDLQGEWTAFVTETNSDEAIVGSGPYNIDKTGNFSSGNLDINSKGVVTGSWDTIYANWGTSSNSAYVEKAKMTANNNIIDGVYNVDGVTFGKFTLIRSASGVQLSDLSGKWKVINFETDNFNNYLSHGFIKFDSSGNIIDSSIQYMDGSTISYTTSSITVDNEGKISGTIQNNNGDVIDISRGQINPDKNLAVLTYSTGAGTFGLTYLVKYGNTFQESDWAAKWHGTTIEDDPPNLSFQHNLIELNSNGGLIESSYNVLGGTSGAFTSISLNLNTQGEISGTATNDMGGKSTLVAGKMSPSKNFAIYAFETDYGSAGGGVYIKGAEVSNNGDNGGSSGGGGGCVMSPTANFAYSWLLLLSVPVLVIIRRRL